MERKNEADSRKSGKSGLSTPVPREVEENVRGYQFLYTEVSAASGRILWVCRPTKGLWVSFKEKNTRSLRF